MQPWEMLKPAPRAMMEAASPDLDSFLRCQKDPAAFESLLDREGVDAAVLVNYVSPDVLGFGPAVSEWVSEDARGRPRRFPMGSVLPKLAPRPGDEADRLVQRLGIRAFKVHPAHQLLYPNAYLGDQPG